MEGDVFRVVQKVVASVCLVGVGVAKREAAAEAILAASSLPAELHTRDTTFHSVSKTLDIYPTIQAVERTPVNPFAMAAPQVHHLFNHPIADHSFSADRKTLAVARDNTVELYSANASRFTLNDELRGHDKLITGVDIAPNSGKIVTCSQDRNAYVWEPSNGSWRPTLVLLRINRAATCVRWSPNEAKFAVGSGARVAAVCYFEEENDWWVSKHLKKPLRSTVTSVGWHPNSVLVALGSTDGHARVLSAFIKGVDERPAPSVWGERLPFNTICGEFLNQTAGM